MGWRWWSLGLAAFLTGCGVRNEYVAPPPPDVTVASPVQREVTEYLEFSGITQPMETVEIRARVKGFLKEKHFTEGAEVKQGQLLLVIDEEPFQIQRDAAQSRLKEAQSALQQATVSKTREVAQAQVRVSESQVQLAYQEEERIRGLFQRQIATKAEIDQATATRKSREAEVTSAKANLDQANAIYDTTIESCQAQVESARIAVRNAELDLSYCRMEAPVDGRISQIKLDIGNLVGDGESSVLATIVKVSPIYAYATVSEADLLKTPALRHFPQVGEDKAVKPIPVELGFANDREFPNAGMIDYTDPSLDAGTGTLRIRGVFKNADRSLLPGMFVRLRIPVATRSDALLVPERALGTDQSGQYVLVVAEDNTVQVRPVTLGVAIDDLRVVNGDLAVTDQVIVEGLLRAAPGSKVTPKAPVPPRSQETTAKQTTTDETAAGRH